MPRPLSKTAISGTGTEEEEEEEEEEGEGGFIARGGIEHSQSRPPRRCIPHHADVVGGLVGRVAAPATKAVAVLWLCCQLDRIR